MSAFLFEFSYHIQHGDNETLNCAGHVTILLLPACSSRAEIEKISKYLTFCESDSKVYLHFNGSGAVPGTELRA